jgi:uncharacterized peroxidase-related enzyme
MRLACLHHGHDPEVQRGLDAWQRLAGPPSDVSLALAYRPEFFGDPLNGWIEAVVRGPSEWSSADRELMGAFTANEYRCPFCTGAHAAIAALSMGGEQVDAVLGDVETAPIEEGLRATLLYLRELINDPAGIDSDDVSRVRSAGVSTDALEDAIQVCAIFSVMTRFANAMNFEGTADEFAREAEGLEVTGYAEWRQEPPARDSR